MGDLLRQLTDVEVNLLDPSTVVSCLPVLARRIIRKLARRRALVIYVQSRTGSVRDRPITTLCLSVCLVRAYKSTVEDHRQFKFKYGALRLNTYVQRIAVRFGSLAYV